MSAVPTRHVASLLDRLTGSAAGASPGGPSADQLQALVERDVAILLETPALLEQQLEARGELERFAGDRREWLLASTVNYGVPSWVGSLADAERAARLRLAVELAIRRFEPRVLPESLHVRLETSESGFDYGDVVALVVSAQIRFDPRPIDLMVRARIDRADGALRATTERAVAPGNLR